VPRQIGYLLPIREAIMEGRPEAAPLLKLAEQAASLGFASLWVGDSVTARPRHEPLTLLAAVSGRTPGLTIGGLRLCKALWSGQPVDWEGRWQMTQAVVAPTPARPGGPSLWIGGNLPSSLDRAGKYFDGWFPSAPDAPEFAAGLSRIRDVARDNGRDASNVSGAMYLTASLDDDAAKADARLNQFLERYYGQPAPVMRRRQACYAGPAAGLPAWLDTYAQAGADHLVLRFAGDHERHLSTVAKLCFA
jgi:alkanesulfonate monooxygenase SsuD/methylene tetrahydromethanopterin reductase-like flavin-dependent oxidoreductase (luciferase family)